SANANDGRHQNKNIFAPLHNTSCCCGLHEVGMSLIVAEVSDASCACISNERAEPSPGASSITLRSGTCRAVVPRLRDEGQLSTLNCLRCENRLLFAGSRPYSGLEVELSFALLVQHALSSGATATHVDPVGWHGNDRARTEIFGRIRVRARVPDP